MYIFPQLLAVEKDYFTFIRVKRLHEKALKLDNI
jgi:hypothetical protein